MQLITVPGTPGAERRRVFNFLIRSTDCQRFTSCQVEADTYTQAHTAAILTIPPACQIAGLIGTRAITNQTALFDQIESTQP